MTGIEDIFPTVILILGGIIILSILIRAGLYRVGVPSLVGFLVLGLLLGVGDEQWSFMSDEIGGIFEFMATVGVVFLLFRVGLESNLEGLRRQLKAASLIWAGNIAFSGVLGYVAAYYLLGLDQIPSLFVAVALTATSVAISVSVWQEAKATRSRVGEMLVDVAEMDDISAMVLMALLFSVVPLLREGAEASLGIALGRELGFLLLKMAAFAAVCIIFSRYIERHLTHLFSKMQPAPGRTLMVAGSGLTIAALAGFLDFSVAIGAFFAGLVFSRDPDAVKVDTPFSLLYDLFTPFFFIGIGLNIDPGSLVSGLSIGGVLLAVAVLGKIFGTATPAILPIGLTGAALLGVSMIPRAEIAMVIMQRGLNEGDWAVPVDVFSGIVVVTAVTAIGTPIVLRRMLRRWPQETKSE